MLWVGAHNKTKQQQKCALAKHSKHFPSVVRTNEFDYIVDLEHSNAGQGKGNRYVHRCLQHWIKISSCCFERSLSS